MNTEDQLVDVANRLDEIVTKYEDTLDWKRAGDMADRVQHVVSQYRSVADNSIFEVKRIHSDTKTQFKALEIIIEGLTSDGMNHGQKRTIANYMITMLRGMVDKIDQYEYTYTTGNFERYNFFRSNAPEKRLLEDRRDLKRRVDAQEEILKKLREKHPDIIKSLEGDDIPF